MKITSLAIEGLLLFEPRVFEDDRGSFMESFREDKFQELSGLNTRFVQDNESVSKAHVLRGLHFQIPTKAQAKLVRVSQGSVLDVAVDLRKGSPTFGQHCSVLLSAENRRQFYIPEGFAHGFLSLEDDTIFSYKCSDYYSQEHERSLLWNDEHLGIDWNVKSDLVLLSEKDKTAPSFADFESPFE